MRYIMVISGGLVLTFGCLLISNSASNTGSFGGTLFAIGLVTLLIGAIMTIRNNKGA